MSSRGTTDGVKTYSDFREMVARPEIDAVQVTTNLHWHALITQIDGAKHSDWLAHIGMHAIKLGRKLRFDVKTETYVDDDEANAMLKHRPFRDGWKLERV